MAARCGSRLCLRAFSRAANPRAVVVGAACKDHIARAGVGLNPAAGFQLATSTPGHVTSTFGGVARNVAEAVGRCGGSVEFVSAADVATLAALNGYGVTTSFSVETHKMPTYVAVLDQAGSLVGAVFDRGDHTSLEAAVAAAGDAVAEAALVVLDGNVDASSLLAHVPQNAEVWFDPTSESKARGVSEAVLRRANLVTPSEIELWALLDAVDALLAARRGADIYEIDARRSAVDSIGGKASQAASETACGAPRPPSGDARNDLASVSSAAKRLADSLRSLAGEGVLGEKRVCVTLGDRGALLATAESDAVVLLAAGVFDGTVSSSGCGDTLLGVAAAAVLGGAPLESALRCGMRGAELTLASPLSVSPHIDANWLAATLEAERSKGPDIVIWRA